MHKLLLTVALLSFAQDVRAADTFAFIGVNVIPMTAETVLRDQTVVIVDGTIAAVGDGESVTVPPGARVIEAAGKYLIPGLTDAHVHLYTAPELSLYLANGVTTVINLNGRPAHLHWRDEIREGRLRGPEIYTAAPTFMRRMSPEESARAVAEYAADGYDAIKIYNDVGTDQLTAIAAAAKKKGLPLIGHVAREGGFDATLRAGVSIAHAEEFVYTAFNAGGGKFETIEFDEKRIDPVARATAAAGVYVAPTISTFRDIIRQATDLDRYLRNEEIRLLAPRLQAGLQHGMNRYENRYSPAVLAQLERALPFQRKLVRALHEAGVPLLAGTDSTSIGPVAGFSIHEELVELVASGLSPYQALRAATTNAAAFLRTSAEAGTIERGKRADLVLLSANPLADIRNTRRIEGVVRRGEWLDAAALKKMIDEVPSAYGRDIAGLTSLFRSDPCRAAQHLADNDPFGMFGSEVLAELAKGDTPAEFRSRLRMFAELMPDEPVVGEEALNELGYALLMNDEPLHAIEVFRENSGRHPRSSNALDSLGEALFRIGDTDAALGSYREALQVDPAYPNAEFARKFIAEHAPAGKK